jgi:hypothetical protein
LAPPSSKQAAEIKNAEAVKDLQKKVVLGFGATQASTNDQAMNMAVGGELLDELTEDEGASPSFSRKSQSILSSTCVLRSESSRFGGHVLKTTDLFGMDLAELKTLAHRYVEATHTSWMDSEVNELHAVVRMNFAICRAQKLVADADAFDGDQDETRAKVCYALAIRACGFAMYHLHFQRRETRREREP